MILQEVSSAHFAHSGVHVFAYNDDLIMLKKLLQIYNSYKAWAKEVGHGLNKYEFMDIETMSMNQQHDVITSSAVIGCKNMQVYQA